MSKFIQRYGDVVLVVLGVITILAILAYVGVFLIRPVSGQVKSACAWADEYAARLDAKGEQI